MICIVLHTLTWSIIAESSTIILHLRYLQRMWRTEQGLLQNAFYGLVDCKLPGSGVFMYPSLRNLHTRHQRDVRK